MRRLVLLVLVVLLGAGPGYAADKTTDAEVAATRAKALYHAGQFAEAAQAYVAAYAKSGKPQMLFNAARATEEAGNLAEAQALYLEYLRLPAVGTGDRQEAQRRADILGAKLRAAPPVAAKAPVEPAVPSRSEPAAAAKGPPAPPAVTASDHKPAGEFPVWQTVSAVAAAGLAVGAWSVANDGAHQANQIDVTDQPSKQRYLSMADSARGWQRVAVGAGVAAGGLAIWALVAGSKRAPPKIAVGAAWAVDSGAVVVAWPW